MYEFHNFLRPILLLMYSFWIPQITTNVIRDSRKPLHPHYILGMTVTRLAIPLYIFGCPNNFMRIEPDKSWCICLSLFIGLQASILLLQHYLGSRWFIPRQVWCNSDNLYLPGNSFSFSTPFWFHNDTHKQAHMKTPLFIVLRMNDNHILNMLISYQISLGKEQVCSIGLWCIFVLAVE